MDNLWTRIKAVWHSRPLALLLPVAALGYYWQTHGHKLPTVDEWIAGSALWAAQFNRVLAAIPGLNSDAPKS